MPSFPWSDESDPQPQDSRRDRIVAATLVIAIVILLITFIVLFIQLDPLLSDFTSSGVSTPIVPSPATTVPGPTATP